MNSHGSRQSAVTAASAATVFVSSLPATQFLVRQDGDHVAYLHYSPEEHVEQGDGNDHSKDDLGLIFIPGFRSSMRSTKACALYHRYGRGRGLEVTLFDKYGEGESSSSAPRKSTVGQWLGDTLAVLDAVARAKRQILVGSSMGVWLAVLAAAQRPERVVGIVGIGSSPDFTERLRRDVIGADLALRQQLASHGYADVPTDYGGDGQGGFYRIYRELLDEAEEHRLFRDDKVDRENQPGAVRSVMGNLPVRLIHGTDDVDVPWRHSEKLAAWLKENGVRDVILKLVEGGDHRLSSSEALRVVVGVLDELVEKNLLHR